MLEHMKAAIFDLDGVLVDTAKYHFLAWKRLADELEIPFTEADNELLKGVSRMRSLEIILELGRKIVPEAEKVRLAGLKNAGYVEMIEKMGVDETLPGAVGYLSLLKTSGIKIALGSASRNARTILERVGISGFFDTVIDGTHVNRAKPDPEVFLLGAETLGLQPAECVVFEDSIAGLEAAKRAGMYAVGIGKRETLVRADMVVNGLHELLPAVVSERTQYP